MPLPAFAVAVLCSLPLPPQVEPVNAPNPLVSLSEAVQRQARRHPIELSLSAARARQNTKSGSWVRRHPVLTGAAIGFGVGFFAGYLPGDDAVFYDFTATFNGLVLGGVGAGAGAIAGAFFK